MAALALGELSLRDADTGNNVVTFDTNPTTYRPFQTPVRGSVFPTLDGGAIRQVMGVKQQDTVLTLDGLIATTETLQALLAKYHNPSSVQELRDWYDSRYTVIFTPGGLPFDPVPIGGACEGHSYTMSLTVCTVISFLGGAVTF